MIAACSSTPKEPTLTKEQQQNLCRPSIQHLVELMTGEQTGGVPMAEQIRTALLERCETDKWGADATQCFQTIPTIEKADTCAKYLTVPQRDGFQQAVEGTAR